MNLVIFMRIVDQELNISQILDIKKGTIPISESGCTNRHSDCFAFVRSGKALYHFGTETFLAEQGDIIYLAKGSSYQISVSDPDYRFYFVDFTFFTETMPNNEIFKGENLKKMENTFIKFHSLWTAGNFADRIYCKSLIYRIYSEIVRENALQYIPSAKKARIDHALDRMKENFSNPEISVEDLCRECAMSEVHFRRLFFQIYHTSPMKYIISLRIAKAKELLTNTDQKIQEVSECCGFNNPYYFSKVFKQSVGLTPSEYRLSTHRNY